MPCQNEECLIHGPGRHNNLASALYNELKRKRLFDGCDVCVLQGKDADHARIRVRAGTLVSCHTVPDFQSVYWKYASISEIAELISYGHLHAMAKRVSIPEYPTEPIFSLPMRVMPHEFRIKLRGDTYVPLAMTSGYYTQYRHDGKVLSVRRDADNTRAPDILCNVTDRGRAYCRVSDDRLIPCPWPVSSDEADHQITLWSGYHWLDWYHDMDTRCLKHRHTNKTVGPIDSGNHIVVPRLKPGLSPLHPDVTVWCKVLPYERRYL